MLVLKCGVLMLCMGLCADSVRGESQMHILSTNKEVSLSCTSTSPWFFCVWEGPVGDRSCALREKMVEQGNSLCGEQGRLEVRGNSSMCTLVIHNPQLSDHGEWTCALSDDSSLETVKDFIQLDMVVEGEMVLLPETSMIEVVEGEKVELVCMVEDVYPTPDISWSVSRDMVGVLDTSSHEVISPSDMSHMVSIQHHVFYTPSHRDHGMNISCKAMQGNMSSQVRSLVVRVRPEEIKELIVEEKIDILAVLFISILVILLIVTLTVIFIKLRKMKQRKARNYIKCVNDDEVKKSFVEEISATKENLEEVFIPDNCHNKSISSEVSTKYPDTSTDNSSTSGQSDTVSTDSNIV